MAELEEMKRKLAQRRVDRLHRVEKASAPITIERMQSLVNAVKSNEKPAPLWHGILFWAAILGAVLLIAHFLGG